MTSLDREFVVTEVHVRRAPRAAFVARHHTPRPWAKYAGYVLVGSVLAWGLSESMIAALIPMAVIADAVTFFRKGAEDTRSQEPVGTTIALGFGDDAFVYRTWIRSGEVPYSAVTKVVASNGCTVIVALSQHIFWPLPSESVPPDALSRMSAAAEAGSSVESSPWFTKPSPSGALRALDGRGQRPLASWLHGVLGSAPGRRFAHPTTIQASPRQTSGISSSRSSSSDRRPPPAIEDRALEVQLLLADKGHHRAPSIPDLQV